MRITRSFSIGLILLSLLVFPNCGGEEEPGEELNAEASASELVLDNGLKLIVRPQQTAGSPLVTVALRTKAGLDQETPREVGYSALLARLLAAVDHSLEPLGSARIVELLPDGLIVSATVLAEDTPAAAAAVTGVLKAEFTENEILAERDRLAAALVALGSALQPSGEELVDRFLFPRSPYGVGYEEKLDSLHNLTAESFRRFAARCLRPERTVVAATGALTIGHVAGLRDMVEDWQPPAAEEPFGEWLGSVRIVPIRIVPRSGNEVSLLLARRFDDPEADSLYPALAVNFIINGRSTYSRFVAVQIQSGLEMPVTSALKLRPGGSFQLINAVTPATKATEVLQNIRAVLESLYQGPDESFKILEQELSDAKNSLRGGLLRRTETSEALARFILWSESNGFDSPDVNDHLAMIESLDKERLLQEVQEHFNPSLYILIAVGPENILRRQFSSLGEVEVVNP